MDIMQRRRYWI